jgi:hypothetical protein
MPTYLAAGILLRTDLELSELRTAPADASGPTWTIAEAPRLRSAGPFETIVELRQPDGTLWSTYASAPDGTYLLRYDAVGVEVGIDPATRSVELVGPADLAETTRGHLVIDQVVPHLAALDGGLVLHASAVEVSGQALAFVAPSGFGKSSLAAAFVQRGAPLLSDDYLLLERDGPRYLAASAYPGLRLWTDSADHFGGGAVGLPEVAHYTDKRRLAVEGEALPALPLGAIVALGRPPRPDQPPCAIGRIRGGDAFISVFQQIFRVDRAGRALQQSELQRVSDLVEAVPVLLIQHRRDYALLPEVLATIDDALADVGF